MEVKAHASDFWNDNVAAQKVMHQISRKKEWVSAWNGIRQKIEDAQTLVDLAEESSDETLVGEIQTETASVEQELADL